MGHKNPIRKLRAGAQPVPQAQKARDALLGKRDRNSLPLLKLTPKLDDYTKTYFAHHELVKDAKRHATIAKEKGALNLGTAHMSETRLDLITKAQINAFIANRQGAASRELTHDKMLPEAEDRQVFV